MCYYATTDYLCGDWKWGNMMLRCPRQHRIGETCGAKLIHSESVTRSATICKICEEINTKQRRLSRTQDNISRWSNEADKFSASLEKACREAKELEDKIKELHLRRPSIATNIAAATRSSGNSRNGSSVPPVAATTLPPVTAITAPATPGYEYTSAQGMNRRHESGTYSVPRNGVMPAVATVNGISLNSGPMASPYASLPAANYMNRSAAVPVDRTSGAYAVSYARR